MKSREEENMNELKRQKLHPPVPLASDPPKAQLFLGPSSSTDQTWVPTPSPAPDAGRAGTDFLWRAYSQTQRLPFIYPESPYPPASPELPLFLLQPPTFFVLAIDSVRGHAVPFSSFVSTAASFHRHITAARPAPLQTSPSPCLPNHTISSSRVASTTVGQNTPKRQPPPFHLVPSLTSTRLAAPCKSFRDPNWAHFLNPCPPSGQPS